MNLFKSIILDDPEPQSPEDPRESDPDSAVAPPEEDKIPDAAAEDGIIGGWSFASLLATRSESVIDTYSKDLMEFGTGLRKETEIIREAVSRAVKDLPASLEAGTSAAHGVLDGVLKSTAEIISKETQVFASESETPEMNRSLNSGRYSWFEVQLSGIQSDLNTFCEEPEDVEEYEKWKSKFKLDEKSGEIEGLIGENGALGATFGKVVPNVVDHDTFWCRYFYRVDKLEQQEKVRANLVKRAIAVDEDDDEYSWDVDDDDEKDGEKVEGEIGSKESMNLAEKVVISSGGSQLEKEGSLANEDDKVKNDNDLIESSKKSGDGSSAFDEKTTKSEITVEKLNNNENVGGSKDESGEKGDLHEVKA